MVKRFFVLSLLLNVLLNLAHPVTPTIIYDSGVGSYMFGVAYACMAIGQLVSSTFWGRLANKYGDIFVICLGLIVYCCGQYGFFLSHTVITIIIVRLLSGIGAGAFMVSTVSYLAKISGDDKAKNLTFYTAVTVFASTLGYLFGGILGDISVKLVFVIQVVGVFIDLVLMKVLLIDKVECVSGIKQDATKGLKQHLSPQILLLNILVIATMVASTCYDQSFNYYLKDVIGFSPSGNGYLKAFVGVAAFGAATLFSKNQKKDYERTYLKNFYIFCMILVLGLAIVHQIVLFLSINTIFFIINGLILPLLQVEFLESSNIKNYSEVSGMFNVCKSLGMIIGALVAGFGYEIISVLPFIIAGMAYLICFIVLSSLRKGV